MKKEKNSMKRKAIKSIAVILMIGIIGYSYPTEIRAASIPVSYTPLYYQAD